MANPIDHVALIRDRLALQYKDSPNLIGVIAALLKDANDLEQVFCDVANVLNVDEATGAQLDLLGELVGQPREFVPDIDPDTFRFDVGPGFDIGQFINNQGFTQLDDENYRRWIRARIASNAGNVSPEEIIASVKFIFGNDTEVYFTDGDTEYRISIGADLTPADRYLLNNTNIVPRTAAVNRLYGVSFTADSFRFDTGLGFDSGTFANNI